MSADKVRLKEEWSLFIYSTVACGDEFLASVFKGEIVLVIIQVEFAVGVASIT